MTTDAIVPATKVVECPGCGQPMWSEPGKTECEPCRQRAKLAERDRLVNENIELAEIAAKVMYNKIGRKMEYGALLSGAYLGLMNAATRFDPSRGVLFATFARGRIDGAMRDDMRGADDVQRLQRARGKKFERASEVFYAREGRNPTEDELRAELGLSEHQYGLERRFAFAPRAVSMGQCGEAHKRRVIDAADPGRDDAAERADWWRAVVRGMTREEKTIILLYFRDGLTMREVARTVGVSMARVSHFISGSNDKRDGVTNVIGLVHRLKHSPNMRRILAAETQHAA